MANTPPARLTVVRSKIYETTPGYYTDPEIYSYMWEAEKILAGRVGCCEATDSSTTTVAATKEYTRPTGVETIIRLTWDYVKLKKIDMTELDSAEGTAYGGVTTSGSPEYYYEFGTIVGLSPTPSAAKTLKYYYQKTPAELSASSTTFTIPDKYAHYLDDYCLYRMWLKDQDFNMAKSYLEIWENNLNVAETDWMKQAMKDRYVTVKDVDQMPGSDLGII